MTEECKCKVCGSPIDEETKQLIQLSNVKELWIDDVKYWNLVSSSSAYNTGLAVAIDPSTGKPITR